MEVGGWVQVSLGILFLENRPKIAFGIFFTLQSPLAASNYSVCCFMHRGVNLG